MVRAECYFLSQCVLVFLILFGLFFPSFDCFSSICVTHLRDCRTTLRQTSAALISTPAVAVVLQKHGRTVCSQ